MKSLDELHFGLIWKFLARHGEWEHQTLQSWPRPDPQNQVVLTPLGCIPRILRVVKYTFLDSFCQTVFFLGGARWKAFNAVCLPILIVQSYRSKHHFFVRNCRQLAKVVRFLLQSTSAGQSLHATRRTSKGAQQFSSVCHFFAIATQSMSFILPSGFIVRAFLFLLCYKLLVQSPILSLLAW